jgi:hypothetical protein
MNFGNPTQLALGMSGEFFGRKYRVVGRVLLGEREDGMVYSWNEFNLETESGEAATLVFEQTQRGPEWRWFTMFEPEFSLPAEDAATKKIGDTLNLDGTDVTVTLVQESRIYDIEGRAPEGQKVGSRANYFNAEAGPKMIVVSWTGSEMEYYQGITISSGMVASAFNLHNSQLMDTGSPGAGYNLLVVVGIVAAFALVFFFISAVGSSGSRGPAVVKYPAPPSLLAVGSSGVLNGTNYHLAQRAQVEIAESGMFVDRQEFYLTNDDGSDALLVYGMRPGSKDWFLFTSLQPAVPLTPQQAGAVQLGQTLNIDGVIGRVTELFRSTVQQVENPSLPGPAAGAVTYGFVGEADRWLLIVRWDENGIKFLQGRLVDAKQVIAAFGKPAGK